MNYDDVSFTITRDDGKMFVLDGEVWRIPSDGLEGWHSLQVDVASLDNVNRDGSIVTYEHVGAVDRTITAEARDSLANSLNRRQAERFFLPKHKYSVKVRYMGRERVCDGVQAGFKLSEGNIHRPISLTWTIFCADPYFRSVDPVDVEEFPGSVGKAGMPYLNAGQNAEVDGVKVQSGVVVGVSEFMGDWMPYNSGGFCEAYVLRNDGDIPSLPVFTVDPGGVEFTSQNAQLEFIIDVMKRVKNDTAWTGIPSSYEYTWAAESSIVMTVDLSTAFGKVLIDFNRRPFRPLAIDESGVHELSYRISSDSMIRNAQSIFDRNILVFMFTMNAEGDFDDPFHIEMFEKFTGV